MRVCVVLIAAVLGLILLAAGSQGQARQGQRAVPSPQWEKEAFRCFEGIASCRIGKKLGAGGIGDVFLVDIKASTWEQKKLPEHVTSKIWQAGGMLRAAMKKIRMSGGSLDAAQAEADAWLQVLPHPNVVGFLHSEIIDGERVIFSEVVDGADLDQLFAEGGQWEQADQKLRTETDRRALRLSLARQMTSALLHMHSSQLTHFDVKPANIMVDLSSSVLDVHSTARLCDFGSTMKVDSTEGVQLPAHRTGHYNPPEVIMGNVMTCEAGNGAEAQQTLPTCASLDGYALAITILVVWGGGCQYSPTIQRTGCFPDWLRPYVPGADATQHARMQPAPKAIDGIPWQAPLMPWRLQHALEAQLASDWRDRPTSLSALLKAIEDSEKESAQGAEGKRAGSVPCNSCIDVRTGGH